MRKMKVGVLKAEKLTRGWLIIFQTNYTKLRWRRWWMNNSIVGWRLGLWGCRNEEINDFTVKICTDIWSRFVLKQFKRSLAENQNIDKHSKRTFTMFRYVRVKTELVYPDVKVKIADSVILYAENFIKDWLIKISDQTAHGKFSRRPNTEENFKTTERANVGKTLKYENFGIDWARKFP